MHVNAEIHQHSFYLARILAIYDASLFTEALTVDLRIPLGENPTGFSGRSNYK